MQRSDTSAGWPEVTAAAVEAEQVKARSQIKKAEAEEIKVETRKCFSNFPDKKVVGIVEPRVIIKPTTLTTTVTVYKPEKLDRTSQVKTTQLIRELPRTFREALLEKGASDLVEMTSKNDEFCSKRKFENIFESESHFNLSFEGSESGKEHQHLTDRVSPNNNRRRRKDVDRSNLTCRGIPSTKCCSLTSASGSRRNKLDRSSDCERCKRDRLTESNTICLESCSRVLIDNVECKSEEEGDCCRRCCFVVGSSKSDLKTIRDDKRSDLATQREMRDVQVVVDRERLFQRRRRRVDGDEKTEDVLRGGRVRPNGGNEVVKRTEKIVDENMDIGDDIVVALPCGKRFLDSSSSSSFELKSRSKGAKRKRLNAEQRQTRQRWETTTTDFAEFKKQKRLVKENEETEDLELNCDEIIPLPPKSSTSTSNYLEVDAKKNTNPKSWNELDSNRGRNDSGSINQDSNDEDDDVDLEEDEDDDEEDIDFEKFSASKASFNFSNADDRWIYCQELGCSFWTRKPCRMERHLKCHVKDQKHYQCPDCPLRFYSLAKMLKHDRKVHTGVKDYECRVCDAEVTDIQIHMRVRLPRNLDACRV